MVQQMCGIIISEIELKLHWYVLGFACSVGGLERDGSRRPGGELESVKPDR
jgi:hypothetical protein